MAWNVYPPAELTSKIVVGTLAAVVVNVWTATGEEAVGSVEEMAERVAVENATMNGMIGGEADIVEEPSNGTVKQGKRVRIQESTS